MLFIPHESGQGLVEYALILILVAIVVVAILTIFGRTLGNAYSGIVNAF
jgi:pilus assembly protein Flp/PilA